ASGMEVLCRAERMENGLSQLSSLNKIPKVCIVDLDFYDQNVLKQLQELRIKYRAIKLVAHSDIDAEKTVKSLLGIGFVGYLLIGSDTDDFKKAIEVVIKGGRYFSVGVAGIVKEYFSKN